MSKENTLVLKYIIHLNIKYKLFLYFMRILEGKSLTTRYLIVIIVPVRKQ